MQTKNKSFKKQLVFTLLIFAILSILIAITILISFDKIYRNIITTEIESTTEVISQSIDKFLKVPDSYLMGIKDHIDQIHLTSETQDKNCIIIDIIDFTKTFENIHLLDDNGLILNTWPHNENYLGIDMSNQEYFKKTVKPGTVYWSKTFLSTKTGNPTVALATKCEKGVIVAIYNLSQLGDFISIQLPDEKDFISVMDNTGNIIAHTDSSDSVLTGNLKNLKSIKAATEGRFGVTEDYYLGTRGLASLKPANESGFIILVFKSYHRIFKTLYQTYTVFIIVIALISVFFLFMILLFIRNFLEPVTNLQKTFQIVASGEYGTVIESKFVEFNMLSENFMSMVDKIKRREKELKQAIEDRETLLHELNHRTKNNLQLITGIMALYSLQNPDSDPHGILDTIQSKIETISLVYDNLYKASDLSKINLKNYIEELIPPLVASLTDSSKQVEYEFEVEEIHLLIDYAVPCGLILNELIINTLKYAFIEKDYGKIGIRCKLVGSRKLEITYTDNGVGLPDNFDPTGTETLGFSIINGIIKSQLRGEMELKRENGFYCIFSFNLDTYSKRI